MAATLTREESDKQSGYNNHLAKLQSVQGVTVEQFMAQFEATTKELAQALPATKAQHDSDDSETQLQSAGTAAKQQAASQAKAQAGPLQKGVQSDALAYKDEQRPDVKPQKLEADPVGPEAQIQNAGAAAPKPKPAGEISLDDKGQSLDDALSNHNVRGQTINIDEDSLSLPKSGEPSFDEAGEAKRKAQDEIKKSTPRYRREERSVIGKSQADIQSAAQKGMQLHHESRAKTFGDVLGRQNEHKSNLEDKKRKVFREIESIYTRTKTNVNKELARLEGLDEVFDGILKNAQDYFNRSARQQLEYIYTPGTFDYSDWKDVHEKEIKQEYENQKRRHEGGSSFVAMDPAYLEALKIVRDRSAANYFSALRTIFIGDVNRGVEEKIAKPVVEALNAAKKHIQDGKADIAKAFGTLGPREQEEAKNVYEAVTSRFDQLEESIDDKQREIVGDLARTYNQSLGKLQSTFDAIKKDVLTSWWEKAWNKIKAVVNAIIEFASRIVELLGRLAYLVGDIVSSPRAFFRNLADGIGQGFSTFIGDIGKYLATAFFDWLRGSSGVAVRMPADLGPKGIFSLFTQLLSLGAETVWERMEVVYGKTIASAFRRGEALVGKGLEIFSILRNQGLGGLWDEIKTSLGSILEDTLESIKENVLYAAIKKVILEIGKLLVPGGGFIAIAEKVIRLLQFIVNARDKILDLIEAFVDSVEMAVKGDIGGIVNHITRALTRFITIALDFLVSLFGLGGLKNKVTGLIERMRAPVIRGIDWVLGKFKPLVMKGKKVLERGKEKLIGAGKAVVQVGVPQDPGERLRLAGRASIAAAQRLSGRLTKALLTPLLAGIKVRYGLTSLEPYKEGTDWWVKATINPSDKFRLGKESSADFKPGEFTQRSLWQKIVQKVRVQERSGGRGTRLSDGSYRWNLKILEQLIDNYQSDLPYSRERQERKDEAFVAAKAHLQRALEERNEARIYARVRDAARVVNQLYAAEIASVPGRQLQAHHRPGVAERVATFPQTRAFRRRLAIERRINDNVRNLTREERGIAFTRDPSGREIPRDPVEREALIRVYVQQQIDEAIEAQAELGLDRLEEFDLDILTATAHLGKVHARR